MPDEKKNAPPEADTTKIDLGKKKSVEESTDAPTEKIDLDASSAEPHPDTEAQAVPSDDKAAPVAKPTAAPRRIPPRDRSGDSSKAVAAESESAATSPRPVEPRKTELQTTAAEKARPQPVGPRRVGPPPAEPSKPSHKKWWAALIAAVVLIAGVATAAFLLVDRGGVDDSPETQIRSTVESFTRALAAGDLATLRSTSCGDLATFYRDIPDAEFADVHRVSQEQGNIPTLDSIDAIQVTDDTTAIAQVIAHTDANPNDRSPRTFDLSLDGDRWKVCN